jgi:hypothetical protein
MAAGQKAAFHRKSKPFDGLRFLAENETKHALHPLVHIQTLAMAWRGAASRTVLAAVRRPAPAPAAARLQGPAPFVAPRHRVPPTFATSSPVAAAR